MIAIVLAHGGAKEAVERHFPNWCQAFEEIILICPADDPLRGALPIGGATGKMGRGHIERMMFAMAIACRFTEAVVMEYDTLIYGRVYAPEKAIGCSELFANDDDKFSAPIYAHSPWVASEETWWKMLTAGAGAEHGFPDRWLAECAHRAGIPFLKPAVSFSTDREWTPGQIEYARTVRRNGCGFIHGVKTPEIFNAIHE